MHKQLQPGDIIGFVNGKAVPAVAGGAPDEPAPNTPTSTTITNTADGGLLVGTDPRPTFTQVTATPAQPNVATVFTVEDIEKARKQEKEKLYPQLEELKATVGQLQKERDSKIAAEKKAREEAEEALRKQTEADTDTRTLLEQQKAEFEARFAAVEAERQQERLVRDMELQFQALQTYKAERLAAVADSIIPQLAEEVRVGQHASKEEIDAHIARLQATSESIMQEVQAAQQTVRARMQGVPVTAPAAGPLDNYSANDPAFEAAANGTLTMNDYIKNRDKLLPAASQMRQQGIYG